MTYEEILDDERWQDKRDEILERDNYECQKCGSHESLQVHHKWYNKSYLPWQYPDSCYITLCRYCHEEEHGIY